jgi:hypothetical protein
VPWVIIGKAAGGQPSFFFTLCSLQAQYDVQDTAQALVNGDKLKVSSLAASVPSSPCDAKRFRSFSPMSDVDSLYYACS